MTVAFAPIDLSSVGIPRESDLFAKTPATPIFNHLLDDLDVQPMAESDEKSETPAEPHPGIAEPGEDIDPETADEAAPSEDDPDGD